jgi:hypothetical protein
MSLFRMWLVIVPLVVQGGTGVAVAVGLLTCLVGGWVAVGLGVYVGGRVAVFAGTSVCAVIAGGIVADGNMANWATVGGAWLEANAGIHADTKNRMKAKARKTGRAGNTMLIILDIGINDRVAHKFEPLF